MSDGHRDRLGADPRPLIFPVAAGSLDPAPPTDRHGLTLRAWVRVLEGMQKEALVLNSSTGTAWRFASDEGPYLAGHDSAPCPLSFFTTGMTADYLRQLRDAAETPQEAGARLILDNRYSMAGSVLQGTMRGGALDPEVAVDLRRLGEADDTATLERALVGAPVQGLLGAALPSRFTLTHGGRPIDTGRVARVESPRPEDPLEIFETMTRRSTDDDSAVVRKLATAERLEGVRHGANSSLQERQRRTLHVRGIGTMRDDGLTCIEQHLHKPIGSSFRFLCDEPPTPRGETPRRAPDAASYLAAGIGFCFLTQLGRYAEITRRRVEGARIVQDLFLEPAGRSQDGRRPESPAADGRAERRPAADPVETHLFLDDAESDDLARTALDMAEQTCFLHALLRTELAPRVRTVAAHQAR